MMFPWSKVKNSSAGNGIAVDQPKVFDNRSLQLLLDQLDATLSHVTAVDQSKVMQNVGALQGSQESESSRSLSVSTLPLPGSQLTEQRDTNSGRLLPQTRTTTTAGASPAAPTLGAESLPSITPASYGMAAQDILSEQVNLSYQILNLRMLLERSVTDRLYKEGNAAGPRSQAVLGFQVSLDPLKQHKGCAAIVEIELSSADGRKAPSLVALMPQAKTYNAAALSRKVNAFGASAIAKVVTVGASVRNTKQSYYLYRDTDTVALQRPTSAGRLVFGWEFRPVLNRDAVEPGIRQLYAVVALDDLERLDMAGNATVTVKVRTYWTKFDKQHAVISSNPREERNDGPTRLLVPHAQAVQDALAPKVRRVTAMPSGDDSVLIDVSGENFYPGTTAIIGGQVLAENTAALTIKSDQFLQIVAKTADVAKGTSFLSGRYGLPVEILEGDAVGHAGKMPDRFQISVSFDPLFSQQNNQLTLQLFGYGKDAKAPDLKQKNVIVTVGQQAFVLDQNSWKTSNDGKSLQSVVRVSADNLKSNTLVSAMIPFLGSQYEASGVVYEPNSVDRVILLAEGDPQIWGITGLGFDSPDVRDNKETTVTADKDYTVGHGLEIKGRNLMTLSIPKTNVANIKNLVVKLGYSAPVVLAPPAASSSTASTAKASLGAEAPTVAIGSASSVEFSGENLSQVSKVSFGATSLPYSAEENGKKLRVFLSRDVTSKAGNVSLAVETKDGATLAADLTVK